MADLSSRLGALKALIRRGVRIVLLTDCQSGQMSDGVVVADGVHGFCNMVDDDVGRS